MIVVGVEVVRRLVIGGGGMGAHFVAVVGGDAELVLEVVVGGTK